MRPHARSLSRVADVVSRRASSSFLRAARVLPVGTSDSPRHERRDQLGKPGRRSPIAQRHPSPAVCGRFPGVRRLHGERPLGGSHHESLIGNQFDDLIRVGHPVVQGNGRRMRFVTQPCPAVVSSTPTVLMFTYHIGTLAGLEEYAATSLLGRRTTISLETSTSIRYALSGGKLATWPDATRIVDAGALREAAAKLDAAKSVTGSITLNAHSPAKDHSASTRLISLGDWCRRGN